MHGLPVDTLFNSRIVSELYGQPVEHVFNSRKVSELHERTDYQLIHYSIQE